MILKIYSMFTLMSGNPCIYSFYYYTCSKNINMYGKDLDCLCRRFLLGSLFSLLRVVTLPLHHFLTYDLSPSAAIGFVRGIGELDGQRRSNLVRTHPIASFGTFVMTLPITISCLISWLCFRTMCQKNFSTLTKHTVESLVLMSSSCRVYTLVRKYRPIRQFIKVKD